MKILYFDDFKLGIMRGTDVVDVSSVVQNVPHTGPHDLISNLIADFGAYKDRLEKAADDGAGVAVDSVRIRPPLPKPGKIDCMAVYYIEDGTRDAPAPINAFHKAPEAVIGCGDTMILPDVPATVFEGEAELGAVIGKTTTNVLVENAMDHIFGYVNFIDGSARNQPPSGNTFFQVKSRETFAPIGSYIVTADEIDDPQSLQVRLWNNGKLMQDFNTDDMADTIPRCIEWLSSIHTLSPGDLVATGTNHRGLNAFLDGDEIDLEAEGMGRLHFNIRDDLKRTWSRDTRLQHVEKGLEGAHTPQLTGKYT